MASNERYNMILHCPHCNQLQDCRSINNQPRQKNKEHIIQGNVNRFSVHYSQRNRRCKYCDSDFATYEISYETYIRLTQEIASAQYNIKSRIRTLELTTMMLEDELTKLKKGE